VSDDGEREAMLQAVTAEHFAMQSAISAALSETQSRSSMFIGAVSGALLAMGFATQAEFMFLPFIATVLPILFVMGVLTVLRLTDIATESAMAEIAIARVRRYYRSLGPESEAFFARDLGRWPEGKINPALRLGVFVAYWTSAASMIAVITALMAAAGVTLLLHLGAEATLPVALAAGGVLALALLLAFHQYQKLRIAEVDEFSREAAGVQPTDA
jgi:hypothetical protein